MTSAGELRERVGFYVRAGGDSSPDYGNPEGAYETEPEFTCAAKIKPRLGGEDVFAARLAGRNFVNITVRRSSHTAEVTTDWRARNERTGRVYEIRSIIDPHGADSRRGRWIEFLCEEGVWRPISEDDDDIVLLESGDALLLESGENILLESA